MEQIQYRPTRDNTGFQPVAVPDASPLIRENNQRLSRDADALLQSMQRNEQTNIRNAEKKYDYLKDLGRFSETLSEQIKVETEKRNEAEMQEGLMMAYTEGVDIDVQANFDAEEEALKAANAETQRAGAEYERNTGDIATGQQIRNLSGWREYGYAMGLAQRGAVDYPAYFMEAKDRVSVQIGNEIITYADARTSAERAAIEAKIRSEFLSGYININPALLNKHLFPVMQRFEAEELLNWTKENNRKILEERQTESRDRLYTGFQSGQAGDAFLGFIEENRADLGLGGARKAATEELKNFLADDNVPLEIRQGVLEQIRAQPFTRNDGAQTTLGEAYARDFGPLEQALNSAENEIFSRRNQDRAQEDAQYQDVFEEAVRARNGEPLTNADIEALKKKYREDTGREPPSFYDDYQTAEEQDVEQERRELDDILNNGRGFLTEEDLRGKSWQTRQAYNSQLQQDKALGAPSSEQKSEATRVARAAIRQRLKAEVGPDGIGTPQYELDVLRATAAYQRYYREYRRAGESEQASHQRALDRVKDNAAVGSYERDTTDALSDKVTPREYANTQTTLQRDPLAWRTQVLPGTEQSLQQLIQYQQTGVGTIPQLYYTIADSQKNATAWDIANAQLIKKTGTGLNPNAIQAVETVSPDVERLLKFKPTPSRTNRAAAISTGGAPGAFLSLIASVESSGFGGYDAYNLGGRKGGHEAIGAGNSNDGRFGKPLSQLTVGEVMDLGSQGRIWAAGKYQFVPFTLAEVVADLGIPRSTPFDAATQDQIALGRARWRMRVDPGMAGLRREWIGLNYVSDAELQTAMAGVLPYFNQPQNLLPGL